MKEIIVQGDEFQGGQVVAAHFQESNEGAPAGVILTFRERATWTVCTIDQDMDVIESADTYDQAAALLAYATQVTSNLHAHFNRIAPGVTFLFRNTA